MVDGLIARGLVIGKFRGDEVGKCLEKIVLIFKKVENNLSVVYRQISFLFTSNFYFKKRRLYENAI